MSDDLLDALTAAGAELAQRHEDALDELAALCLAAEHHLDGQPLSPRRTALGSAIARVRVFLDGLEGR